MAGHDCGDADGFLRGHGAFGPTNLPSANAAADRRRPLRDGIRSDVQGHREGGVSRKGRPFPRGKAVHFLEVLKQTRCPGYRFACWGYPFDWQTRNGIIKAGTPLVTTVPYCYEAFEYVYRIDRKDEWREMLRSIAEHTLLDYQDVQNGPDAATCTYTPFGGPGVVNASAYRSFLLTSAALEFGDDRYSRAAAQNLNFVLQSQKPDGSWPYSVDGARGFVDHFHTCFVMKGLAKIDKMAKHEGCRRALQKGVEYY